MARDGFENNRQVAGRASGVVLQQAVGPGIAVATSDDAPAVDRTGWEVWLWRYRAGMRNVGATN